MKTTIDEGIVNVYAIILLQDIKKALYNNPKFKQVNINDILWESCNIKININQYGINKEYKDYWNAICLEVNKKLKEILPKTKNGLRYENTSGITFNKNGTLHVRNGNINIYIERTTKEQRLHNKEVFKTNDEFFLKQKALRDDNFNIKLNDFTF